MQSFGHQVYGAQQPRAGPLAVQVHARAIQAGQAGQPAVMSAQPPFIGLPGAQQMQSAYWQAEMGVYPSSPNLLERIIHQVHYYFSAENLCRDEFLRGHMDQREGWLPIQLIASFNRLRSLTMDVNVIAEALRLSPELEVREGLVRKRHDWQCWLLPHAQLGGPTSPTPSSPDSKADATSPLLSPRLSSTGFSRAAEAPSADPTGSVSYENTAIVQQSRSSPGSSSPWLQQGHPGGKLGQSSPPPHLQPQHKQPQHKQPHHKQPQHKQQHTQPHKHSHNPQPQQLQQPLLASLAVEAPSSAGSVGVAGAPVRWRDAGTQKSKGHHEVRTATVVKGCASLLEPSSETGSKGASHEAPAHATAAQAHGMSDASSLGGGKVSTMAVVSSKHLASPSTTAGKATRPVPAERSAGKHVAAAEPSDRNDDAEQLALLQEWELLGNGTSLADWRAAHDMWVEAQLGSASSSAVARAEEEPWETAQPSRRSARKGGISERKESGDAADIGLSPLHLKDSPPLSDRSSKGDVRGSSQSKWDENRSDQTTLLNDEDWSSAGSTEEPRPASPDAQTDGAAASTSGSPSPSTRGKRLAQQSKAADKAAAQPSKPRILRELRDAPLLESRRSAASMLAAIDFDLVVSAACFVAAAASRCVGAHYERVLTHTPRTRALVRRHGAERHTQMALAFMALLLLLVLPTSWLPPTPGELGASRWLELPVGLVLGIKVNDLGNKLWTLCTPCPTQHGRAA